MQTLKKIWPALFIALTTLSLSACRANLGNFFDLY